MKNIENSIALAAKAIKNSKYMVAFTGAGVSVESGIPPFRGADGLWSKYDPQVLDLNYFLYNPYESWVVIKEIFYDFFGKARPNPAHIALAELEKKGVLKEVITQNIDNLHQEAGNAIVHEFHGNSQKLICTKCRTHFGVNEVNLDKLPVDCPTCGSLLKPDFIFFGEGIPMDAYSGSKKAAEKSDVFLIIGSTGEVSPANQIPMLAKQTGSLLIEINPEPSRYTNYITDIYLPGKAGEIMTRLITVIFQNN